MLPYLESLLHYNRVIFSQEELGDSIEQWKSIKQAQTEIPPLSLTCHIVLGEIT
jgi:hypothetical protein